MAVSHKPISFFTLGMMNVAIVASLQMMTACAVYGYALLCFYLVATLVFFIPCLLIVAQLSTAFPQIGGSYIWAEKAFGKEAGFFAVCIQWLANLIWYPTIFSFITTTFAYLVCPALVADHYAMFGCMALIFLAITALNACGLSVSSLVSTISAILGVIVPTLLLIGFGAWWSWHAPSSHLQFSWHAVLPNITDFSQVAFLTQIVISLIGQDMVLVHAGDVKNPARTIPRALAVSGLLILCIVIAAPLSIAQVIPADHISVVAGLLDAFKIFFQSFHMPPLFYQMMLLLILIGNCGSVTAWMLSSTRGMQVASKACTLPAFFYATNRYNAPVGILLIESAIFLLCAATFLFFETINNAYWMLLSLACQIALIYYLLIFAAAVKIARTQQLPAHAFKVPGGFWGTVFVAGLGAVSVLVTIILGFFPPELGGVAAVASYPIVLGLGLVIVLAIPCVLLGVKKIIQ